MPTLAPHTPLSWVRKRSKALGNLSTFHILLMQTLDALLSVDPSEESVEPTCGALNGICLAVVSILSTLFNNVTLPTFIQEVLSTLTKPLAQLYEKFSRCVEFLHPSYIEQPFFFFFLFNTVFSFIKVMKTHQSPVQHLDTR